MSGNVPGGQVLNGRQQFIGADGRPLAGGTVEFYRPGTLTPVVTYQDPSLTLPNTNPVVLDAGGMATVFATDMVRQIVKDRAGNLVWDRVTSTPLRPSQLTSNVATIAALRANTVAFPNIYVQGYYSESDGGEGLFYLVSADTTSPDDGGAIIVDASGNRYYRVLPKAGGRLSVKLWGARGDNVTNDAIAVQRCFSYADQHGFVPYVPPGDFYSAAAISMTTYGNAPGVEMDGTLVAEGGFGAPALAIGRLGANKNARKTWGPLRVRRRVVGSWADESDVGIRLNNADSCVIEVLQAEGFTIGVQTFGDQTGFEDSNLFLSRIVDNRIGLDVRTGTANGWNNAIRYFGGHFACSSSVNTSTPRFGVRFSREPGAYNLHNAHSFYGPSFELQRQGTPGTVDAIPFLLEVDGRGLLAHDIRMEACSPVVARHTGSFNDAVYEVNFIGTYAFTGAAIEYTGSNRAGGSVIARHQAAASQETLRVAASAPNVRSLAFRNTLDVGADGVGFEGMAIMSGNPSGSPTTLNTMVFAGLNLFGLNASDVTVPTSRAIGFVVDCLEAKEFVIAPEGIALRPVVAQFDVAENVLGAGNPVLFSNMNTIWAGAPSYFHEGAADFDTLVGGLPLNSQQRVTLNTSARYAFIGVRGSGPTSRLSALRLFSSALVSPMVLFGNNRPWGRREYTATAGWNIPGLAQGVTTFMDMTLAGVRQGDLIEVGFAKDTGFQNGSVTFHASVANLDTIRVTARNDSPSVGTITVGPGTIYARALKPRL